MEESVQTPDKPKQLNNYSFLKKIKIFIVAKRTRTDLEISQSNFSLTLWATLRHSCKSFPQKWIMRYNKNSVKPSAILSFCGKKLLTMPFAFQWIIICYNIARVLTLYKSYWAAINKFFIYARVNKDFFHDDMFSCVIHLFS